MSESPNEPDQSVDESADQSAGDPAEPVISDEQLPEDLQPEKNPLARDPDDTDDTDDTDDDADHSDQAGGPGGSGSSSGPDVESLPNAGDPGA